VASLALLTAGGELLPGPYNLEAHSTARGSAADLDGGAGATASFDLIVNLGGRVVRSSTADWTSVKVLYR
jgi:hypothetical protein